MSINYKHINTLTKVAESNPYDGAKLAAAIVRGNRIISVGLNQFKTHPFQARYSKNKDCIYLHAELAAIKNALREINHDEYCKCDLYVVRVKRPFPHSNNFIHGLAKPCIGCARAIVEFNIRRVIYTTDIGKIEML